MTLTSLKNTEIYIPEAYIISCEQKWPCVTGVDLYNNSKLGFWCIKIHSDSIFWSHFFFASFGNFFFFVFLYSVLLVFITIFFFPLFFLLHISWGKGGGGELMGKDKGPKDNFQFHWKIYKHISIHSTKVCTSTLFRGQWERVGFGEVFKVWAWNAM